MFYKVKHQNYITQNKSIKMWHEGDKVKLFKGF